LNRLILELIEPLMPTSEWTATVWLFNNSFDLLAYEQYIDITKVDEWTKALQQEHNLLGALSLIAIAPPQRGHVRTLAFKKGQAKYVNEVTPVLMERFLAQPIEDMHFTSKLIDSEQLLVCAVSRHHIRQWYDTLRTIHAFSKILILPQVLLIDVLTEDKNVRFLGNNFQLSEGHMFASAANFLGGSDLTTIELGIEHLAEQMTNANLHTECNLLHGDFAYSSSRIGLFPYWKTTTALFLFFLMIACGWLSYDTSRYMEQADGIEKKAEIAFLALAPEEGRVVNLKRQIEGRIRSQATNVEKQNTYSSPYVVLNLIDKARVQTKEKNALQLMAYRDGVYILEWRAERQETLEFLRANLEQEKLNVYLDQVIKNSEGYIGSYRIQGMLK
jgi:type II secretion system protein L